MTEAAQPKQFGKIRNFIWPIHGHEMKKFIPMFFMFFFISFNYSILRNMKDSLVLTAPGSGADVIPFLKLWGTTPVAILFTIIYMKLSSTLTKEKLFYATLVPFATYFLLFPLVIYPNLDILHPTTSADYLLTVLPEGFKGLIAAYRNWSFTLFYIFSELWGSFVLSILFWTLANDITKVTEAKRFYGLFLLGANVALMAVAPALKGIKYFRTQLPEGADTWGFTINSVLMLVLVGILGIIICSYYIRKHVMTDPRFYDPNEVKKEKKAKVKMGLIDGIRYLLKSKYLACIAILVLAYGVAINLVEVNWKHHVKMLYPNGNDNLEFMADFAFSTGLFTCILLLLGTGNILRRFGWGKTALITPVMLLVTGLLYFTTSIFSHGLEGFFATFGTTPLAFVVLIGMIQNVMTKGSKYSFFDPTKEMAYIPLDDEGKIKGKAAIDGVGGRLGKSGGALINMVLIMICGSVGAITPYVAVVVFIIVALWIWAAIYLNKQFVALTGEKIPGRDK